MSTSKWVQHIGPDGHVDRTKGPSRIWNKGPETPGLFRLESFGGQFLQFEDSLPGNFCNTAGSCFKFGGLAVNMTVRISDLGNWCYFFVIRHPFLYAHKMSENDWDQYKTPAKGCGEEAREVQRRGRDREKCNASRIKCRIKRC